MASGGNGMCFVAEIGVEKTAYGRRRDFLRNDAGRAFRDLQRVRAG